jgi:hypothetical protein
MPQRTSALAFSFAELALNGFFHAASFDWLREQISEWEKNHVANE